MDTLVVVNVMVSWSREGGKESFFTTIDMPPW